MPSTNPELKRPLQRSRSAPLARSAALDAIAQVQLAEDAPQLLERLREATIAIGVTASIYTVLLPESGAESSSLSLFACHPALAESLCRFGRPLDHAWLRPSGVLHRGTTSRTRAPSCDVDDAASLGLARRCGFKSCLAISAPGAADLDRIEVLCLGSVRPDAFEDGNSHLMRTMARALAGELHEWVTGRLCHSLRTSARLRNEDIQLLRFESQGLTTKEISLRTGISSSTLDSQFRRLNVRMRCRHRKDSARRAAAYGLLQGNL